MATDQDISLASRHCREALQRRDLAGAKAALEELRQLEETFAQMRGKVSDPDQRQQVEDLEGSARGELEGFRSRVSQLEIDMLDPNYEQRARARDDEKASREAAEKAKAAQFLQNLGGPFAALAGLANLGKPQPQAPAPPQAPAAPGAADEVPCASCASMNPRRAKFCMECGKPTARRCSACNAELGKAKFCPECGAKAL